MFFLKQFICLSCYHFHHQRAHCHFSCHQYFLLREPFGSPEMFFPIINSRSKSKYLVEKISPNYMQQLQSAKETIENIIGRKHAEKIDSIEKGGIEDPGWVNSTSR